MAARTRGKETYQPSYSTHELELKYQLATHEVQITSKDEQSRRLRVRRHLEVTEREDLRQQLRSKDQHVMELQSRLQQAESAVKLGDEALSKIQHLFTAQARELTCLKAELSVSNAAVEDSAQILSEKLRLTRELSILKPEVEHLRSQVAHHTNIIAEKLSLERQLNSAEVELEAERKARRDAARRDDQGKQVEDDLRRMLKDAEKRATTEAKERQRQQSIAEKYSKHQANTDELNGKLRMLEAQILADRRDKDQITREAEVFRSESQAKIEMLEQRLETLKAKLRAAQSISKPEDSKMAQIERTHHLPLRKDAAKQRVVNKRDRLGTTAVVEPPASSPETTDMKNRKALRKRATERSLVGEKSLFSVTPFLNRNKTLGLDALAEDDEGADTSYVPQHGHSDANDPPHGLPRPGAQPQTADTIDPVTCGEHQKANPDIRKVGRPRGRPRKVLSEASPNIAISALLPGGNIKHATTIAGEKSPETLKIPATTVAGESAPLPFNTALDIPGVGPATFQQSDRRGPGEPDAESKKRKRRLVTDVSNTIFDELEPDDPAPKIKRAGKMCSGIDLAQGPQKARSIGLARNAFGGSSFSPLKKERRGVGASFLV